MRRLHSLVGAALALLSICAAPASAQEAFGLKDVDVTFVDAKGAASMQAGSHPFALETTLDVNTTIDPKFGEIPVDSARDVIVELPAGMAGTPTPVPRCSTAEFLSLVEDEATKSKRPACPDATAVGAGTVRGSDETGFATAPTAVYNLQPPPGAAAKFGLLVLGVPVALEATVNPDPPYNIVTRSTNISQAVRFHGITVDFWGVPGDPAHDPDRGFCAYNTGFTCPVSIPQKPFLTLPRSCEGPMVTTLLTRSWQDPGTWLSYAVQSHDDAEPPQPLGPLGCASLGFAAGISAKPTSEQAESPAGLDFELAIEDEGLTSATGIAQSDLKKAVVTLPEGVTANPSLAAGLHTCSPAQLAAESVSSEAGEGCPPASTLGTVEVETPLLEGELLKGHLYIATPDDPQTAKAGAENPFDSLLALYIVIKHPELGILVKLAGRVSPDPNTGQLVTTFGEAPYEIPQFPFSSFRLHFREGGRSPLVTPPTCGTFATKALLTPTANPANPLAVSSSFQVTGGVGGGPCPKGGISPFEPGFAAGTLNNSAGQHSPFHLRLQRRDADQDLVRFDATLPPGAVAKLAGVGKCSDSAIASLKTKTGKGELANPSCPASSKIGTLQAGAGVGSQLTYVPGSVYLAGPFAGAPLSVVGVVPAVAGPFDVGVVATRQALTLDPVTGEVEVDGARSDPIPHILAGIPLKVRDVQVNVDRPNFTLNPTNCSPLAVGASIWGGGSDLFSAHDDSPVSRSARFQATNCALLGFKPRLAFKLKGGTKRGQNPAFEAILRPRAGDANLERTVVRFPRATFLDQGHIRTICTRVQFAQDACPKGAIYGRVKAFTPLLEEPLQGPVYLRSSDNLLPDIVFDLKGVVDVEVAARADSVRGRLRVTFRAIPDAPVSKVIVKMQGAEKGLLVNSRDICERLPRAQVLLGAHNARTRKMRVPMRARCEKGQQENRPR